MTLFAGIFNRQTGNSLPTGVRDEILRSISRVESDERICFGDQNCFLVHVNLGHSDRASSYDGEGRTTLLNGSLLLGESRQIDDADAEIESLHSEISNDDLSTLAKANGVFSIANYDAEKGELRLITDKLGLRPVYYFADESYVVFASSIRVFEDIDVVPKRLDVRAMTEIVGLGYALDDRTPYADVKLLRAAESITFSSTDVVSERYFSWNTIETQTDDLEQAKADLYSAFLRAVTRRLGDEDSAAAFLSGGLDSRCIVAALTEVGASVQSFNFARPETQDQLLGRLFADAIGSDHVEIQKQAGDLVPDYSELVARELRKTSNDVRPKVWSGEGGSVALGHVHLTESIVAKMRSGEIESAVNEHLEREFANVSPKMFATDIADRMNGLLAKGIAEELSKFTHSDPARNFYLHFLLLNDQHRKLANHFENIDIHRVEFELPFFDSSFIEAILRIPLDSLLRHSLYVDWLAHFPSSVSSIPWQSYPGHVPCPLPLPEGLAYQWADEYQKSERAMKKRQFVEQSRTMFRGDFPEYLLNKRNLRLAGLVHSTGLRDYGYLIGPAYTIFQFLEKCGCHYHLPF